MRLGHVFLAVVISSASALQQRVVAHSADAVEMTTLRSDASNFTETITDAPVPIKTAMPGKPAVEASIMGLVVFSAAGLVLL
ncbi:hypothetical protein F4802DRAFT_495842 [Xylaria palmicola]|nr:hypothetical protein F4802DRAFT_495842 [Xylaria palmicola]